MTTRTYKYGKHTCKAYMKAAGKGWEVGFHFAGQEIFVGNFIHAREAKAWWTKMNTEARKFSKRYALPPKAGTTFLCRFWTNYMYKSYYTFLDRQFSKYNRNFTQAVRKDERKHAHMRKHAAPFERPAFRRAA
jgi:hypothetical protein